MCGEMKFDAGGFVVDADVEGVRRDGRGGAGKEAWGEWVGGGRGEIEKGTCCRFASNCSSSGHTDQNHLRTGFPGSFKDLLDEARFLSIVPEFCVTGPVSFHVIFSQP